jgi:hypothetical protein
MCVVGNDANVVSNKIHGFIYIIFILYIHRHTHTLDT